MDFWLALFSSWRFWIVTLFVAVVIVSRLHEQRKRRRLRPFIARGNCQALWRSRFPQVAQKDVIEFLRLFADAFALPLRHSMNFAPDDRLMDIYDAKNPGRGAPDELEFESLALAMEKRYECDLHVSSLADLTLRETFVMTQTHA